MYPTSMYIGAFVEEMRDDSIMSYCQMDLLGGGEALWVDTGHWSKVFEGYVLFLDRLLLPHLLLSPFFFLAAIRWASSYFYHKALPQHSP